MQLDPPAKRVSFGDRPKLSQPQPQANGFIYFPLDGPVLSKHLPVSVKPILQQIGSNRRKVPDQFLIPSELGANGKPRRTARTCWMKGCGLNHNCASCPRLVNYLQRYPNMDGVMPNEWVAPSNSG
ncbi:hypothetical protein ABBQ32_000467 [Trebouxia sp. C0010 RCD-2024]